MEADGHIMDLTPVPIGNLPYPEPTNVINANTTYPFLMYNGNNGNNGISEYENSQIALAIASSLSRNKVKPDPHEIYLYFMNSFLEKKFKEASLLYESADIEAKGLIDAQLDKIPWRISCEYYKPGGKLRWINSWIKLGCWSPSECEMSPQLIKGRWVFDHDVDLRQGIGTLNFECAVWKGTGKEMIHRIVSFGKAATTSNRNSFNLNDKINIELELQNGFLVPVDIAFNTRKNPLNTFDLGSVEIGSLEQLSPPDNLDVLRMHHSIISRTDGSKVYLFRGNTLGALFIEESDMSEINMFDTVSGYDLVSDVDTFDTFDTFDTVDTVDTNDLVADDDNDDVGDNDNDNRFP